jgi:hypothetical protein
MRRTLTVCRNGLAVAAAVVLLTACGGSGNDNSASSSSSATSSSASGTSADAASSEFCTQAAAAFNDIEPAVTGQGGDPASLAPALQQAADKVRAIDPPSEISSDWTALADGIEQFAKLYAEVDVNDPASQTTLQQRATELLGQVSTSATNVQTYLAEKCGLGTSPTETASPTS